MFLGLVIPPFTTRPRSVGHLDMTLPHVFLPFFMASQDIITEMHCHALIDWIPNFVSFYRQVS